jgi:hypothetical protein
MDVNSAAFKTQQNQAYAPTHSAASKNESPQKKVEANKKLINKQKPKQVSAAPETTNAPYLDEANTAA